MKTMQKSVLGVTLLEIMLVLAIAAMVIVMSIRYYQSAQSSSQANQFISQIQGYVAAAENLKQGSGSFTTGATKTNMESVLPGGATNAWNLPWGGTATYSPTSTGFSLTVGTAPATNVCALITSKIAAATKITISATCTTVTYNASL